MQIGRAKMIGGLVLGAAVMGAGGCASDGGGEIGAAESEVRADGVVSETARWVEAAGASFARQGDHVRYVLVPDRTHDLLILEQGLSNGGRVTWLIEVGAGASGTVVLGGEGGARGWVIEHAPGESAHHAGIYGELVLEDDGDDGGALRATVHASADRRPAHAGEVIAPTHTVWGEYRFEWMDVAMAGG